MKQRTVKGELLNSIIHETFQLNGTLLARGNEIAKPFGLTSARWQVLSAIDLEGRPLTVSQIARRMGLTRQSVQRIINDLTELSMVTSSLNMDHKRSLLFSLSELGVESLQKTENVQMTVVNEIAEVCSADQLSEVLRVMEIVKQRAAEVAIDHEPQK